jgi:hypothetical protein
MNKNNTLINKEYNEKSISELIGDGYDSNDEIKLEIIDNENGKLYTQVYTVPYRPTHCNEKRLICFSTINNEKCGYDHNCTYAHTLEEQIIDEEKQSIYQMILDKKIKNFQTFAAPKTDEVYKNLLFLTHVCENCKKNKCTGGYNCRNGVCNLGLKLCKNDLLTGECLNKPINIEVSDFIIEKLKDEKIEICDFYEGCINGHHLSTRGLLPYYKYLHQKENCKKNKYQSVRYIDINPLNRIFKNNYNDEFNNLKNSSNDSDSTTDEEISNWFQHKNNCDDELVDNIYSYFTKNI